MNFELLKTLKEAGFPQEPKPHSEQTFVFDNNRGDGGSFYMICPAKEGCCFVDFLRPNEYVEFLKSAKNNPPNVYKIPTLSELIGECGSDIYQIEKRHFEAIKK